MERASAILLLAFGAAMCAISLALPPTGEIDGSVLMLFGQILVFAQYYTELVGMLHGVHTHILVCSTHEVVQWSDEMDKHVSISTVKYLIHHSAV